MAIFDFLRRKKKLKEDQKLSPTEFLKGYENSSKGIGRNNKKTWRYTTPTDEAEVANANIEGVAADIGNNVAVEIPKDADIIGGGKTATRRIGTTDLEMGYKGTVKPLNIQKPKQNINAFNLQNLNVSVDRDVNAENPNVVVFRDRMMSRRNKRKKDAQARYEEQIEARSKRAGARQKRTPEQRQKEYDEAFANPLGENTILGRASANIEGRQQAMIDRAAKRAEERRKKEAAKNNNNK